jgi:hypothetical protein
MPNNIEYCQKTKSSDDYIEMQGACAFWMYQHGLEISAVIAVAAVVACSVGAALPDRAACAIARRRRNLFAPDHHHQTLSSPLSQACSGSASQTPLRSASLRWKSASEQQRYVR